MFRLIKNTPAILFCCMTVIAGASTAYASHPYHVSKAELNWNPKTGNFEVALCVWPADLEKAIARQQQRSVDLDKVDNLDDLMRTYVEQSFLIRVDDRSGSESVDDTIVVSEKASSNSESTAKPDAKLRWVGHELTLKEAWLYFEIPGNPSPGRWEIENRVFFELNDDQMNLVQLTTGEQVQTVVCAKAKPSHLFDTEKSQRRRR